MMVPANAWAESRQREAATFLAMGFTRHLSFVRGRAGEYLIQATGRAELPLDFDEMTATGTPPMNDFQLFEMLWL